MVINYNCFCFSQGLILEHLPSPYPRVPNPKYTSHWSCVGICIPTRGHSNVNIYRLLFDRLDVDDIIWRLYKDHGEVQPFSN